MTMVVSAAALLALCSFEASAQFTGVVAAPRPKAVATVDSTPKTVVEARDSVARINLTNMKDWVDSAASSLGVPAAPAATDTTAAAAPVAQAPAAPAATPATPARGTTEFREGAAAPNTATPIPLLAVIGLSSLVAGLWLMRRRRA
jgi:LPXTG-motif cell wall-anchored protein